MFNATAPSSDDDLFELLANPRRRLLLYHLFDREEGVHLGELSRRIVAFEMDVPLEDVDEEKATSVYVSLYQTHIPTLEEHALVEYDDTDRVVYLGPRADDIIPILRDSRAERRRWTAYYLTASGVFGAVVLLSVARVIPRSSTAVFTVGAAAVLVALAASHYYTTRIRQPSDSTVENLAG